MKKSFLLLFFTLAVLISARAQNLIQNSTFAGFAFWNEPPLCAGVDPEAGFTEDNYGGPSGVNQVAEVDIESCLRQTVSVTSGSIYNIQFDATRRTTSTCIELAGTNPGINVKVTGVTTGNVYSTADYHYNNETWVGYTTQNQTFAVTGADAQVKVEITPIDNTFQCGIVMDNVTMVKSGILAVNLVSFNAAAKNNTVDLSWVTNNEVNNDYFEVYRSKNGVSFTEIGKVNATGFATGSTYNFNDAQPGTGTTYYRLKVVDKSANYKLSGTVKANLNTKSLDIAVYPTIVTSVLNYVVESPKAEKLRVMVTDISGKRIVSSVESFTGGTTQKSINVSTLASGVYLLTIVDDSNTFKKTVTFKKN